MKKRVIIIALAILSAVILMSYFNTTKSDIQANKQMDEPIVEEEVTYSALPQEYLCSYMRKQTFINVTSGKDNIVHFTCYRKYINAHYEDYALWEMSGLYNKKAQTVEYVDATMSVISQDKERSVRTETIAYENGVGRMVFSEENGIHLTWHVDQDTAIYEDMIGLYRKSEPEELSEEYIQKQEPISEELISGNYGDNDETTAKVAISDNDEVKVIINHREGTYEATEWVFSGIYDDKLSAVNYSSGFKFRVKYKNSDEKRDGEMQEESRTMIYNNGIGFLRFTRKDNQTSFTISNSREYSPILESAFDREEPLVPDDVIGRWGVPKCCGSTYIIKEDGTVSVYAINGENGESIWISEGTWYLDDRELCLVTNGEERRYHFDVNVGNNTLVGDGILSRVSESPHEMYSQDYI